MNHMVHTSDTQTARLYLLADSKVLNRKVRNVAAAGDGDKNALALYTLAAGHRFQWTTEDWAAVLNKLDDCEMTVGNWLKNVDPK